ncbi:hypothetical protein THRCLA_06796 [Thraustotheca clavata]|uniref:Transmembrane protein n=1 Tax=Thraustotheca clavata TaxID=74557 RepID=A0A1V9ZJ19_9STRA|nr:hypothetical protein THRCLA_06796 [Thraustotheca clavata]
MTLCQPSTPEAIVRAFPPIVDANLLNSLERTRFVFSFFWLLIVVIPVVFVLYYYPGQYIDVPSVNTLYASPLAWYTLVVGIIFLYFAIRYCVTWPEARRMGPYYWNEVDGSMTRHTTIGHYIRLTDYHLGKFSLGEPIEDMRSHFWMRWSLWTMVPIVVLVYVFWYRQTPFTEYEVYFLIVAFATIFILALQYLYVQLPLYVALQHCPELGLVGIDDERIPFAQPVKMNKQLPYVVG